MVTVRPVIVLIEQAKVEVPRVGGAFPGAEFLERSGRHGDGRETRRTAHSLLRATECHIDTVPVDFHRHCAERSDCVGKHERIQLMRRVGDRFSRIEDTRGRLGLNESDHMRPLAADRVTDFLLIEVSPHGLSQRITLPPWRLPISAMRSQKNPFANTRNLAPGSTKLQIAVSIPALPVPEIANVNSFVVPKAVRKPARISSTTEKKYGSK